jgi:hypothetical protein
MTQDATTYKSGILCVIYTLCINNQVVVNLLIFDK